MPENHFGATGHLAQQGGAFEPQRQNNFSIMISGLAEGDGELISLSLRSLQLPNESNEIIELPYGNEKVKLAGMAQFDDIPLTVRDFVDRRVRDALVKWRQLVYDARPGQGGRIGRAANYKKSATITLHAPDGADKRIFTLIGVWPSAMNAGQLDMGTSDTVEIELTLTYDKAFLVTAET